MLLTAGLNKPPLILKKTHALTASEKPKLRLMYKSSDGFFCATCVMTVLPVLVFEEMFATLQLPPSNQHLLLVNRISFPRTAPKVNWCCCLRTLLLHSKVVKVKTY